MLWFDNNGKVIIESCRENLNRLHRGKTIYGAVGVLHDWRKDGNGGVEIHATLPLSIDLIKAEMPDLEIEVLPIEDTPIDMNKFTVGEQFGKDANFWVFKCELPPYRHVSSYALLLMRLICEHIRKTGRRPRSLKGTFKSSGNAKLSELSMKAWHIKNQYGFVDVDDPYLKGIIDWTVDMCRKRNQELNGFIAQARSYRDSYTEETMRRW